jgi:hypothetical protein
MGRGRILLTTRHHAPNSYVPTSCKGVLLYVVCTQRKAPTDTQSLGQTAVRECAKGATAKERGMTGTGEIG